MRQAQCPTCSKPLTVDLSGTGAGGMGGVGQIVPKSGSPAAGGGRAPKKHSILSRVNLANFQSSTKIEVR